MKTWQKVAAATAVVVIAVGLRVGMIYRERNAPAVMPKVAAEKTPEDELVFLKKKRPSSLADEKTLVGSTLWVSAGGQMDFYPYGGHRADYAHSAGVLLGAEKLLVKDAFEQVAPKMKTQRIPSGEKQVLLGFTRPDAGADAAKEYAVPVGYKEAGQYMFFTDEIFFYDDPHVLYKHWGPEIWKAVDEHRAIVGMSEAEVQMALGQVSKSLSEDYGNRRVVYSNLGHPVDVIFVKNKATAVLPD